VDAFVLSAYGGLAVANTTTSGSTLVAANASRAASTPMDVASSS
jgi:hypothetical protein